MPLSSLAKTIKIFFSYDTDAPKDKRLFEQLTTHLSSLKRQQLIQEWYDSAITVGNNIAQFIETYMGTADIIVLLISADFLASDRCYNLEMKRALELDAAGTARLIPVRLRPADWQGIPLNKYSPLPPDGKPISRWRNIDDAFLAIVQGIRRVIEEISNQPTQKHMPLTAPNFPLHHIPYRYNAFFTDRETILATLSSSFMSGTSGTSGESLQTTILALNGLGGIGKTQIALTYLYRSADRYQTILWLNAASRDILSTEVNALAARLALSIDEHDDEQQLFSAFKQWLQDQTAWLIVLDQITDVTLVDLIIPSHSNGHVLLTTRTQALGNFASVIPIAAMSDATSVEFLLHRARIIPALVSPAQATAETIQQASQIARALDGFPLALDQAGAYLEETGCGLSAYLSLLQQQHSELLSRRGYLADSHPESVMMTLSLAFEQIAQKRSTNLDLLHLLAFLQPDAIPDEVLVHGASVLNEPLQTLATQPLALHEALADLLSFSLLQHDSDATTLRIHRIVQDILIDTLTPEQRYQQASQIVRLVNYVFPEGDFASWNICERYLQQAQHCSTLINRFQLTLQEAPLLLERLGAYCYQRGCYDEAETYLVQALDLHKQLLTTATLDAAQTLNTLALLYHRQARYAEAETLHQQALALREQLLGPDHSITAESLHNLAVVYGSLGKYQQAEQLYRRVLALDERTMGAEDPETAKTLNNLGMMHYLQDNYSEAEKAYHRALTIYEHALPANHPDLTYTLNSLGTLYEKQGKYSQALELYQRALAIREETFGSEHPETAHSINKLADIYESLGDYVQAEALYQRALAIGEQELGNEHPDVALFLNNLAFLAEKQGQYLQALELYQRALSIYEHVLGLKHPITIRVLNNLQKLYHAGEEA